MSDEMMAQAEQEMAQQQAEMEQAASMDAFIEEQAQEQDDEELADALAEELEAAYGEEMEQASFGGRYPLSLSDFEEEQGLGEEDLMPSPLSPEEQAEMDAALAEMGIPAPELPQPQAEAPKAPEAPKAAKRQGGRILTYELNGEKGLVHRSKNQRSGSMIGIYIAEQAGLDASSGPWAARCETHGAQANYDSRRTVFRGAAIPTWCESCQQIMEQGGKPAPEPKAAKGQSLEAKLAKAKAKMEKASQAYQQARQELADLEKLMEAEAQAEAELLPDQPISPEEQERLDWLMADLSIDGGEFSAASHPWLNPEPMEQGA